jgi:hypothetical protein
LGRAAEPQDRSAAGKNDRRRLSLVSNAIHAFTSASERRPETGNDRRSNHEAISLIPPDMDVVLHVFFHRSFLDGRSHRR